jgi:small-conductance mechanosensitive channel
MKVANRHMLYAEGLAGWFAASGGISVWLSKGMLWSVFAERSASGAYAAGLGIPLILFGLALMAVCTWELISGREWSEPQLLFGSRVREYLNLALCLAHAALLVALIQVSALWEAPAVTINTVGLIVVFAFATIKARRLCYALDPRYPTQRLRQEIPRSL